MLICVLSKILFLAEKNSGPAINCKLTGLRYHWYSRVMPSHVHEAEQTGNWLVLHCPVRKVLKRMFKTWGIIQCITSKMYVMPASPEAKPHHCDAIMEQEGDSCRWKLRLVTIFLLKVCTSQFQIKGKAACIWPCSARWQMSTCYSLGHEFEPQETSSL